MDLPALERNISNLERSLDSLEFWLAFMTGLVVLGLALEYWHEIREAIAALKQAWSWKPLFVITGGILITIGVAGELAVQFIASRKETELRKATDAVFASLNTEAAKARKEAGDAVERASNADERASKNEKEAAQLGKLAEGERLARIEVEAKVAWRRLTKTQQSEIGPRLNQFRWQRASIWHNANDLEGSAFAIDIFDALVQAKWNVAPPQPISRMYSPSAIPLPSGVIISNTGDDASRSAVDALVQELSSRGFDIIRSPGIATDSTPTVFISVEYRPQGAQGQARLRAQKMRK